MHLSTSNSEGLVLDRPLPASEQTLSSKAGIIMLLTGLAIILTGFELGSPFLLDRLSHTEHRVAAELRAARGLQPTTADGRPTVLLAGNSLLLEGVQLDRLRDGLGSQYEVSRLGIEQTHYLDWYFGLRRLLEEGCHPSEIVLSLSTEQIASRFTLGEQFAHRQMSTQDFPLAVREVKLDRTTASTYLFAHWSNWLADKGVIRQRVLIVLVPNFRRLAGRIAEHGPHVDNTEILLNTAQQRLPDLASLAHTYGVKIVLLIPPTLKEDHSKEIQEMGARAGVPVWVLSSPGELPRELYRDGFHLNEQGSALFTDRLAKQIQLSGK